VPRVPSAFTPAWWLPGGHLQTLWPNLARRRPRVELRRSRWELPDGDFLDLDWTLGDGIATVLVLHGLEGSSGSHYARGLARALSQRGYRVAIMHFRGCTGEPNRLDRSYHSGETGDIDLVVRRLRRENPDGALAAVGYSLGGNVLLKWLGELGADAPVSAAVAVSVPFELASAADRLACGLSRVYQSKLLGSLRRKTLRKFARRPSPLDPDRVARLRTFREFDDYVTAPLHGFADADDYYARCSSRSFLKSIRTPTLILHALDDPFMTPEVVPSAAELSPQVTLEIAPHGGHVGFVSGPPWHPVYWLEERIPAFLDSHLVHSPAGERSEPDRPFAKSGHSVTIPVPLSGHNDLSPKMPSVVRESTGGAG
jgi:predicted alpha/beta-fold hydrolase